MCEYNWFGVAVSSGVAMYTNFVCVFNLNKTKMKNLTNVFLLHTTEEPQNLTEISEDFLFKGEAIALAWKCTIVP